MDLNSSNSGCARLGSGVAPPLGVVKEEVAVLIALVRRNCCAVSAAVCRAVDDEAPSAVEEKDSFHENYCRLFSFLPIVELVASKGRKPRFSAKIRFFD